MPSSASATFARFSSRSASQRAVLVLATVTAVFVWAGCGGKNEPEHRSAMVVISGDTGPWIVPCGCTANQSGGLLRRATYLAQQRATADVAYADVGGAAAGTSEYFKEKFHAVLRGEVEMGIVAHNLGRAELALGPNEITAAAKLTGVPFVSTNTRRAADGAALADALRIVTIGKRRVAFVGVVSPQYATADVSIEDPRQAVTKALQAAKPQFDSAIVLAYLPDAELQQLAADLPEVDAVIGGPTGQAQVPHAVGPVLVAAATNKGKFLIKLMGNGASWNGDVAEMSTGFSDDPQQAANLHDYLLRLGELDLPAEQTGLVTPISNAPANYRIAGSPSCTACHAAESSIWQASAHVHAGESLKRRDAFNFDAYCLQCHTTGYGLPGGFSSPRRTPALTGVGCESCHGPSTEHAARPNVHTSFNAFDQCIRCHDHENSPHFDVKTYWSKIQHGKHPTTQPGAALW